MEIDDSDIQTSLILAQDILRKKIIVKKSKNLFDWLIKIRFFRMQILLLMKDIFNVNKLKMIFEELRINIIYPILIYNQIVLQHRLFN